MIYILKSLAVGVPLSVGGIISERYEESFISWISLAVIGIFFVGYAMLAVLFEER